MVLIPLELPLGARVRPSNRLTYGSKTSLNSLSCGG
jgi:hypothetical protein